MSSTRRIKRMERRKRNKIPKLNLTSLMDVFTILLVFLLVNSGSDQSVQAPQEIALPESVVESKPRETVVIMVGPDRVLVQGEVVMETADILNSTEQSLTAISERLTELKNKVIGVSSQTIAESKEVTVLADKTIPFSALKKIMSSCTSAGYGKISLAVIQKANQS